MKIPCCSVCQTRYNEEERVPLLLQCGHGFCRDCLSRMFAASLDATLACPRCRHVSTVGNSVQALRKNYAVLALLHSNTAAANGGGGGGGGGNFDCDYTDDEEEEDGGREEDEDDEKRRRNSRESQASSSGGCEPVIEVGGGAHQELKLVRRIGEGRRAGVEMWMAVIGGGGGGEGGRRCRHSVAVKKVAVVEGMDLDWVQGKLEDLRRASMWCRNVCTFHGTMRVEDSLCLVMDKCYGSVQSVMQRNEGRLTLEQVLRFWFLFFYLCSLCLFFWLILLPEV